MINKTQLINKITEKAGLLSFDSEQFFEIFLLQMSSRMKAGEVFEIKDLGYFSLKCCKLNSETGAELVPISQEKPVFMILFSEDSQINEENKNIHFFSIPELVSQKDDDIESHLSLSVETPLVTENEFAEEIFSAFKSNSEIRNNFTSKADILINTMKKVDVEVVAHFTLKVSPKEFVDENVIEEKSIPQEKVVRQEEQTKRLITDIKDSSSSLPWDFGRKFFERKIDYPEQDRINAQRQIQNEEKNPVKGLKSIDEDKIIEKAINENSDENSFATLDDKIDEQIDDKNNITPDVEEKNNDEKIGNFERVRTYILNESEKKEKPNEDEIEQIRTEETKSGKVKKIEDDFTPVKSKSETYQLETRKKKKKKQFLLKKDSISLSESKERFDYHRSKRGFLPFAIPLGILIIAIGAVFIYLEKDSIISSEPENVVLKITPPPHVNIIERDFEFAVTYPYSKSENYNEISGIDPSVFKEELKLVEENPKVKVKEPDKKVPAEQKSIGKIEEKVESKTEIVTKTEVSQTITNKNISKYKDYYIVQVAAYKTYETAEVEAEKFRNQGYNAFIEIADLPGRGTWYRIKVGDFTSVKHAEDFLNKNRN
jgi:cell division septation protein DedD/nucleoid DNA-binding protein